MMGIKEDDNRDAFYSLLFFRIAFGTLLLFSTVRFLTKGWVYQLYIQPKFFFPFLPFEWLKPLPGAGMYIVFGLMAVAALGVALGWFYRISMVLYCLLFTYVELLDKSNYLNHYYFISLLSLLLCFIPLDAYKQDPAKRFSFSPVFYLWLIRIQVGLVYVFAGIAKIKSSWLLDAQPLKIWLAANSTIPVVGGLLEQEWVAYAASWFAMLFDLTIPFWLLNRKTTIWAYILLLIFHCLTSVFFYIGVFPLIMSVSALIFFPSGFHRTVLEKLKIVTTVSRTNLQSFWEKEHVLSLKQKLLIGFFVLFFLAQLLIPFRYFLYDGNVLWTEQGFRFSWNVMLMEKTGYCEFTVKDSAGNKEVVVNNRDYLTVLQERMMSTQPDMMVQYAHFLAKEYTAKGFVSPRVYADAYVSLNGRSSRRLVDPARDLAKEEDSFQNKKWILRPDK